MNDELQDPQSLVEGRNRGVPRLARGRSVFFVTHELKLALPRGDGFKFPLNEIALTTATRGEANWYFS